MTRIENINDVSVLQQVAKMQEREIENLLATVHQLHTRINALEGRTDAQPELLQLKELLQQREDALFGDSSEKRRRKKKSSEKKKQTGHGPTPQPELDIVDQTHELPADARDCDVCGGTLQEMKGQYEESEEITVIERKPLIVHICRQKYRCRCNANVVTAPGPAKLKPGCRYSLEFAVDVAISKYLDHQPLERQARIFRREGLTISSQSLWDLLNTVAHHAQATYEAIGRDILAADVIHADETWWRRMDAEKGRRKWWLWGMSHHAGAFYRLCEKRDNAAAVSLLDDYGGIVVADGYVSYKSLAEGGTGPPRFRLAHCWAHARRKFVQIEKNYPVESKEMLDLIGRLYEVERDLPAFDPNASRAEQARCLARRRKIREKLSKPIIDEIHTWLLARRALPQSGLGKAIAYVSGHWKGLTLFLTEPGVPLDNNAAERSLRGAVIGRKNHYGSRSKRGTEVAAILYSLMESAKLAGIEPRAYLLEVVRRAIETPDAVTMPLGN